MSEDDRTGEILTHLQYLREGQDESNRQLREINGRLRVAEQRVGVLETRADDARMSGAKWGAGVGAVMSALINSVIQAFK